MDKSSNFFHERGESIKRKGKNSFFLLCNICHYVATNRTQQIALRRIVRSPKAHRMMRDIIRFKSYMMHCSQQLYDDEDMDLRVVEMSEQFDAYS